MATLIEVVEFGAAADAAVWVDLVSAWGVSELIDARSGFDYVGRFNYFGCGEWFLLSWFLDGFGHGAFSFFGVIAEFAALSGEGDCGGEERVVEAGCVDDFP